MESETGECRKCIEVCSRIEWGIVLEWRCSSHACFFSGVLHACLSWLYYYDDLIHVCVESRCEASGLMWWAGLWMSTWYQMERRQKYGNIGVRHEPEQVTKGGHVGHVSRDRSLAPWCRTPYISMATKPVTMATGTVTMTTTAWMVTMGEAKMADPPPRCHGHGGGGPL